MTEINNIIELATNSKTERLSFATRYLVDINFTFDLTVISKNFSGMSHFCIRVDQIKQLCTDLSSIHLTLSGNTKLEDNDSDSFIEFNAEKNGHLLVSGQVGGSHEDHFVRFKFYTDQTCIPALITDFTRLLRNQNY